MAVPVARNPVRAKVTHAVRCCLVLALLWLIPAHTRAVPDGSVAPQIGDLPIQLDASHSIKPEQDANGMWQVVDADGEVVSMVARTLPAAAEILGYRGPTESAIVFDRDLRILAVGLLSSADTDEHVSAVIDDKSFFNQFQGWPWGGPTTNTRVDAVSGATLTSLALAEGVLKRIGGTRPSLVFGDPLRVEELRDWFPDAVHFDPDNGEVRDSRNRSLGRVIRTGPLSDDVIGYQGPTELLVRLSDQQQVEAIRIRTSFDNEPYVDYVRTEAGFWQIFNSMSLEELAGFNPPEAGVEGVSGATMTSLAVADTIVAAARAAAVADAERATPERSWLQDFRWTPGDLVTLFVLVATALISQLGWFHKATFRRLWLSLIFIIIGLWSGNLVSLALISGWSAEGIAWKLAPGLFAICAVALIVPPLTKGNPYCNHLCPHGAVQQLVRPRARARRHLRLPRSVSRWLSLVPGITVAAAYLAVVSRPAIDLSTWEPFHAYLFRIAPWAAIAFAGATIALAAVIPMGYCRLGCPTGRLVDYLRRSARSDRIGPSDGVAASLLVIALLVRYGG